MEWEDEGFVLYDQPYAENSRILNLLTRNHGLYAGLIRQGRPSKKNPSSIFVMGHLLKITWRGRLIDHLGRFYGCELSQPYGAYILEHRERLLCLSSAACLLCSVLPEREPHQGVFDQFHHLIFALQHANWAENYVCWEINLLDQLGYGLSLEKCVVTGQTHDLMYVSPKSGCAVSQDAGKKYHNKLLPLPAFLGGVYPHKHDHEQVTDGLELTGQFIFKNLFHRREKSITLARNMLISYLQE